MLHNAWSSEVVRGRPNETITSNNQKYIKKFILELFVELNAVIISYSEILIYNSKKNTLGELLHIHFYLN